MGTKESPYNIPPQEIHIKNKDEHRFESKRTGKVFFIMHTLKKFKWLYNVEIHFREMNSTSDRGTLHIGKEIGSSLQKEIILTVYYSYPNIEF